jgi:hypothetical protein
MGIVCIYSVFVLSCAGSGLVTGWSPVQGVLRTVYRIKKLIKSGQGPTEGCRAIIQFSSVQFNSFINTGFLDFVHRPEFYKQENTTFRKLDLFPTSGEGGAPTLLGTLEKAYLNHRRCQTRHFVISWPQSSEWGPLVDPFWIQLDLSLHLCKKRTSIYLLYFWAPFRWSLSYII